MLRILRHTCRKTDRTSVEKLTIGCAVDVDTHKSWRWVPFNMEVSVVNTLPVASLSWMSNPFQVSQDPTPGEPRPAEKSGSGQAGRAPHPQSCTFTRESRKGTDGGTG